MLGGCCVCADENGWESNPLVYCDGPNCEVAVHQGCYGIVEVPEGEWYCAKCAEFIAHTQYNGNNNDVGEVRETPRCKLCPFGHGALKRTDDDDRNFIGYIYNEVHSTLVLEWAHVICALYIPEVRFGDVHSMDPVILSDVPLERFQQQCYLCIERGEDKKAYLGACMPCNKAGCKKCFHVTCAQAEGLLCEEGGGSKNVKYCGYCASHAKKAVCFSLVMIVSEHSIHSLRARTFGAINVDGEGNGGNDGERINCIIAYYLMAFAVVMNFGSASNRLTDLCQRLLRHPQQVLVFKNISFVISVLQIGDPLIKIIPPYRLRAESSCSSGSGGGGGGGVAVVGIHRSITPKLSVGNICSGENSTQTSSTSSPHFNNSELIHHSSASLNNNYYANVKLPTVSSVTENAVSVSSSMRTAGSTMLIDPLHRPSLQPATVDRTMLSAMMSQSLALHAIREDACSPPVSSGRSSTAHSTPPPVTVSLKKDQSLYDLPCSSNASVPLPSNVALFGLSNQKNEVLSTSLANTKDLNNGNLISQLEIKLHSKTNYASTDSGAATSLGNKAIKRKAVEGIDRPKRPRNTKACKSMKALLESVGPLISETVSDFQRERLNERDGVNLTSVVTSHPAGFSISDEQSVAICTSAACTSASKHLKSSSQCIAAFSPTAMQHQQSSPTAVATVQQTLVGVPLLRAQSKAVVTAETSPAIVAVDRAHVTSSLPSTSGAVTSAALCPVSQQQSVSFPQSMEELLERQWEQGSHFLMSHAPFDIAQLLSCLHELKMENVRLEETLSQLARRRDHLLALNTRLSLSLASGSSVGLGTSPHHSPRISATGSSNGSSGFPVPSTTNMQSSSCISSVQCSVQPTSSSSISTVPSIITLPSSTVCAQQHQQQSIPAAGTSVTSFLNPFCHSIPPVVDDSLSQLRTLASNGSVIANRTGHTPQTTVVAASTQLSSGATENCQTSLVNTLSATASSQQTSLSSTRLVFARNMAVSVVICAEYIFQNFLFMFRLQSATSNTGISTPLMANFDNVPLTASKPSVATPNALDLFGGSQSGAHLTLTSERQQIAAAAIAAAAAANALTGGFVAPRAPGHSNATVSGASTIGQLAPTEILAQYALLAQQQLLHQQAAVAALSARYGSQVISSSTSPHSTAPNTQLSSNSHSGK
ncbi:unnamed protein product [Thelazia callipaeda]|uniref:PHD-type domain-containing protein n=1 Tax=Thelazia callipaeda TaxID=103827 RepID=A0A0N5CVJ2_THECL|nr:unnamed protein product [Thelazia callipaeda]